MTSKIIFLLGLIAAGLVSTPMSLVMGIACGMCLTHPYPQKAKLLSSLLLQASVIGLGFGMNLHEVVRAGQRGFFYTAVSIALTIAAGWGLGCLL